MKHYIDLFYNDIKVSFYEQNGLYFMLSEDVGRCLRISEPKNGIRQYMHRHPDLASSEYSVLAQVNSKLNRSVRCFTQKGLVYISNLRGDHRFKQWVDEIYKALNAGLLHYEESDAEDIAAETKIINSSRTVSDTSSTPELLQVPEMTNFERAQIIIGIAGLSEGKARENLKQAAMDLLLGHDFEDVYEARLKDYDDPD